MQQLATAMLLATLVIVPAAFADSSADAVSAAQPRDVRPVASGAAGRLIIFLRDGRTIQAEKAETLGNRIQAETPTARIDLPPSRVLSIHRIDSSSGSPSSPSPVEVYRGLTQQMTDRVRGQIEERSRPAQGR